MSFWSKKPDTQQIPDTVTEKLSEITNTYANIELRLQKLEEGSNKRQLAEINTRIDDIQKRIDQQILSSTDSMNQILSMKQILSSIPITFTEYKKLIDEVQHKQTILEERIAAYDRLEERIAAYDEKFAAYDEKFDRLEEQSKKSTPYKSSPLTKAAIETNVSAKPSWMKKTKVQEEPVSPPPTINLTVVREA